MRKRRNAITQERLQEVLDYDKETGIFKWKRIHPGITSGSIAGTKTRGYIVICIDRVTYQAHRLAWLYINGYLPEMLEIDHIDRIGDHNWISNLRVVSHLCNTRNRPDRSDNTSGITGISWDKNHNKWRAHITIHGKHKALGRFDSKIDAATARWEAEKKYGFPDCCTFSSAFNFLKDNGICN